MYTKSVFVREAALYSFVYDMVKVWYNVYILHIHSQCEEEARLRLAASQELSEFRAEHESETEREREEARRELQRQLKVFREEQEEKHNKVRLM